jgi:hypothetical protein
MLVPLAQGFVVSSSAEGEQAAGLSHRAALDAYFAEHLNFDLKEVLGIEEVAVVKQRLAHGFIAGVKTAVLLQKQGFVGNGHEQHLLARRARAWCSDNYAVPPR